MGNEIFEREIGPHWADLKRLVYRFTRDEFVADDVLQMAFVKALTTRSQPRSDASILPWFKQILKHTALDVLRKQQRMKAKEAHVVVDMVVNDDGVNMLACRCVHDLLKRLSSEDQLLLKQLDMDGMSLQEMAEARGLSKNVLKVRRHRARQRLKQYLMTVCRVTSIDECQDCGCDES